LAAIHDFCAQRRKETEIAKEDKEKLSALLSNADCVAIFAPLRLGARTWVGIASTGRPV